MVKIYQGRDTKGQLYLEWEIAPDIYKRAWVQYRSGKKDWAGTVRYVNVVRVEGVGAGPAGFPADFPVYREGVDDSTVLTDFVEAICKAVGR